MQFKSIVINKYDELRVGWRLLAFIVLAVAIATAVGALLRFAGLLTDVAARATALAATLGASYVMTRFVNKKPFSAIGFSLHSRTMREFGVGCLLGFLMITGVFVVEVMAGYIQIVWRGYSVFECVRILALSLLFFGIAAFFEEALFRGYPFQTLIQWITFLPATMVLSLLFAYAHSKNPNVTPLSLLNVGLAGVWLSIAYMKTRSLWLPFGLHVAWNFSQTTLYSFPTSGGSFSEQRLADLVQTGPEWITGGAFGPEGGILATIALVVCTWYILKSKYLQAPEGIITLDSVEDIMPVPETNGGQP